MIRKATTCDYFPRCDMFTYLDTSYRDCLPHKFMESDGSVRFPEQYAEWIADQNVDLFIVDLSRRIAGFVHTHIKSTAEVPNVVSRRYTIKEYFVVRGESQNRDIGRLRVDAVRSWAIQIGAASLELNVNKFNRNAIAFYEELGYQTLS